LLTLVFISFSKSRRVLRRPRKTLAEHKAFFDEGAFTDKLGYLLPKWFDVDIRMTDSYLFIKLKHLDEMFKRDRKVFIENMVSRSTRVRFEPKNRDVLLSRMMTYAIEKNEFMYSAGILPIKIRNLWSYDGFDLRVGIRTEYNVFRDRLNYEENEDDYITNEETQTENDN